MIEKLFYVVARALVLFWMVARALFSSCLVVVSGCQGTGMRLLVFCGWLSGCCYIVAKVSLVVAIKLWVVGPGCCL